ncbi:uncharacterized protein DAT39_012884, partial [Clarias magur]
MAWSRLLSCLTLFVICGSVTGIETLHKLEDLKTKRFGHEYPRHGLLLLHWLANHISIGESEETLLLDFDPAREDYGFSFYENANSTLPNLDDSGDREYYSLGSLSLVTVRTKLPPYVTQDYYNAFEDPKRDLDRILLRVQKSNPYQADKVYITQAVAGKQNVDYDPDETYEVSPKLVKQIQILKNAVDLIKAQESPVTGAQNTEDPRLALPRDELLNHLKYSEKHLQTIFEDPSVRWLLILAGYDITNRYNIHKKTWLCPDDEAIQISSDPETLCEGQSTVQIEVKFTKYGYAKIIWSSIPKNIKLNASIELFSSDTTNRLDGIADIRRRSSGSYSTYLPLNHGIQPRLVTYTFDLESGFIGDDYSVLWRGPQFDEANRLIPTKIKGYDASLQLYTKYGYACARLYIKNSFTDWKKQFVNSWVALYSSYKARVGNYQYYQWVTSFRKVDETKKYLIYEYQSPMSIGPGAQARFVFSKE